MWKKSNDFSGEELSRLLSSPQAQALARMLQQMDPKMLNRAAELAAQGDTLGAKDALQPILSDPNVQNLIQNKEESHG